MTSEKHLNKLLKLHGEDEMSPQNSDNRADLTKVWEIYQRYIDNDLLEDRREYTVDDLISSEWLPTSEATYLYKLIQSQFDPNADSLYHSNWEAADALKLAGNISESIHHGFDGWADHEKVIITLYLHDLGIAQKVS